MKTRIGVLCFLAVMLFFSSVLYGEDRVHTVRRGETFYSIARTMGVKAEDLMKYNGISDPSKLQTGQKLKIPPLPGQAASPQAASPQAASASNGSDQAQSGASYRVVRGDTLYSIARKFSVTVAAIQEANKFSSSYVLRVGDTLKLPANARISQGSTGGTAASSARWPVTVRELSYMTGKLSGVVITGAKAESVKSLTYGTVLSAGPYRGFGRVVIVQVEGSYLYVYGGCENLSVKEGDSVGPGTELGNLGIDAVSNKAQLFFMVYRSNAPIDPAKAPRA